jgi:hypothetical protein
VRGSRSMSSPRTRGPITTNVNCCASAVAPAWHDRNIGGVAMRASAHAEVPDRRSLSPACPGRRACSISNSHAHTRIPAARIRPSDASIISPKKNEGVGNAGCPLHPQPRVGRSRITRASSPRGSPGYPAFPHAMVLTAYFVISSVIGLYCHRRLRIGLPGPVGPTRLRET